MLNFLKIPLEFLKYSPNFRAITLRRLSHKSKIENVGVNAERADLLKFHEEITGKILINNKFRRIIKQKPKLATATNENLTNALNTLKDLQIDVSRISEHYALLIWSPPLIKERVQLLRESGFKKITLSTLARFLNILRYNCIDQLKREKLIYKNINIKQKLLQCFKRWPATHPVLFEIDEEEHTILDVRLKIMQQYFNWRLSMPENDFEKYIEKNYTLKFKSFTAMQETIDLEENEVKFSQAEIIRNSFLIGVHPQNIKEILEIPSIAGVDIKTAIKIAPSLLISTRNNILESIKLYKEYNVPDESLMLCLKAFSYSPQLLAERLEKLSKLEEFKMLLINPRFPEILTMYNTAMSRLEELRLKKDCYSIAALLSSKRDYQRFMNSLGSNVTSRDHTAIVCLALDVDMNKYVRNKPEIKRKYNSKSPKYTTTYTPHSQNSQQVFGTFFKQTTLKLKRHSYGNIIPHKTVYNNVYMLKKYFSDEAIYDNCEVLFYPSEILQSMVIDMKDLGAGKITSTWFSRESLTPELDFSKLNDHNTLSLILYAIERKYHFSDKGVWMNSTEIKH